MIVDLWPDYETLCAGGGYLLKLIDSPGDGSVQLAVSFVRGE